MAKALHSPQLMHSVQAAFVHGMDLMLAVGAGISVVGLVLGVIFLPNRSGPAASISQPTGQPAVDSGESEHDVVRTA